MELSSLVVVASRRGEGIGSALLHQLVSDAVAAEGTAGGEGAGVGAGADKDADAGVTLCLLTLRATSPFYQRGGFVLIEKETDVPRPLQAERAAGGLVVGPDLIVFTPTQPLALTSPGSPDATPALSQSAKWGRGAHVGHHRRLDLVPTNAVRTTECKRLPGYWRRWWRRTIAW